MEIEFNFDNCLTPKKEIKEISLKLKPELNKLKYSSLIKKDDPRNCLNLIDDNSLLEKVKEKVKEKKSLHPELIIIIGVGGSNLGTKAVESAIIDEYKSHQQSLPKLLYADSLDSNEAHKISKILELELAKGKNPLVCIISKSGSTLEVLANFEIFLSTIQTYKEDYKQFLIVISNKESMLHEWAKNNNISFLEIPGNNVGRFSVFSPVSLFPLAMLNIKIEDFFKGARIMHKRCLEEDINKNPAMLSAAIHYYHYKKNKIKISNLFLFSKSLENLGKWHRQLMAESLGKEFNLSKKRVNSGITPIVSIGTIDLHSMEQLYLAGPNDKLTTFVSVKEPEYSVSIPLVSKSGIAKYIQGYNLNKIMNLVLLGVEETFVKKKRAFISLSIPNQSENSIGQFIIWKMMETIFLAHLLGVNAFDQPAVESYKKAVRELLSNNSPL